MGFRVLTDPVLRSHLMFLRRVVPPLSAAAYDGVDIVVISHLHHDHCDLPSLTMLGRDCLIVVPSGADDFLRGNGFRNVVGPRSRPVTPRRAGHPDRDPAVHDGKRKPFGPKAAAVGYLITSADFSVYFAGDTDLFPAMRDLSRRTSTSPCCRSGAGDRTSVPATSTRPGPPGRRTAATTACGADSLGHALPVRVAPLLSGPAASAAPRVRATPWPTAGGRRSSCSTQAASRYGCHDWPVAAERCAASPRHERPAPPMGGIGHHHRARARHLGERDVGRAARRGTARDGRCDPSAGHRRGRRPPRLGRGVRRLSVQPGRCSATSCSGSRQASPSTVSGPLLGLVDLRHPGQHRAVVRHRRRSRRGPPPPSAHHSR